MIPGVFTVDFDRLFVAVGGIDTSSSSLSQVWDDAGASTLLLSSARTVSTTLSGGPGFADPWEGTGLGLAGSECESEFKSSFSS